jgi:hypothetical protein
MTRRLAVLCLASAAISGCSSKTAANGPVDKARSTVAAFLAGCARGDAPAVADLLAEDQRAKFIEGGHTRRSCDKVLKLGGGETTPPGEAKLKGIFSNTRVTNAETNGGFASVSVEAPDARRSTVELESVRGIWYLSNPLP